MRNDSYVTLPQMTCILDIKHYARQCQYECSDVHELKKKKNIHIVKFECGGQKWLNTPSSVTVFAALEIQTESPQI